MAFDPEIIRNIRAELDDDKDTSGAYHQAPRTKPHRQPRHPLRVQEAPEISTVSDTTDTPSTPSDPKFALRALELSRQVLNGNIDPTEIDQEFNTQSVKTEGEIPEVVAVDHLGNPVAVESNGEILPPLNDD